MFVNRFAPLHPHYSRNMQPKRAINTDKAPMALPGIYNQAIVANGTVYCSGSIGMDPSTGKIVKGDIQDRTVCSTQHRFY
jgi:enamine deaminase RidA (YjgF/YER057c/UK114 family)